MATTQPVQTTEYRTLSECFGTPTKLAMVEYLAVNGQSRQVEIADGIDVSQAAVSRSKQSLLEAGVLTESNRSLQLNPPYSLLVSDLLTKLETDTQHTQQDPTTTSTYGTYEP